MEYYHFQESIKQYGMNSSKVRLGVASTGYLHVSNKPGKALVQQL